MPFTFAHPAIVLPLKYLPARYFSLTGLVIGSLLPDFEYFLRMNMQSQYSHTTAGIFWFDLPLGILLAFLFHNLVRNDLVDNLPSFLRDRFSPYTRFSWNAYFAKNGLVVIGSLLIGIGTHIFWDSFTHQNAWFVQTIPALQESVFFLGHSLPLFKLLQHGSSLIGMSVILWFVYRLPLQKENSSKIDPIYWLIFVSLVVAVLAIRMITGLDYRLYGHVIVNTISATLLSLCLTPLALKWIYGDHKSPPNRKKNGKH